MASSPELNQDFQEELICSICREYFTNPMSTTCGHTFCSICLIGNGPEASTLFSCPECGVVSSLRDLRTNQRLGKLANIAKHLSSICAQNTEEQKPETYQTRQKLFSVHGQSSVTESCPRSREHQSCTLPSTEDEIANNYKEKIQKSVDAMWRKAENVMEQMTDEKMKCLLLEAEVKMQKKNILSEFQKVQQFLDEEKAGYLLIAEQQGKVKVEGLKKRIKELSHLNQEMWKRISELEEECKKPDVDLLQDMKRVLNRNEPLLQKEIDPFLLKRTAYTIPGITEMLLKFKEDITMDCNTACPGLFISEDLKTVTYRGAEEQVTDSSERLIDFAQVLGTQSFISGKCYFEVEVPQDTEWCVGFSQRADPPENVFVLMSQKAPNAYYLFAVACHHHLYYKEYVESCKISGSRLIVGVFLDFEHGEISFYNARKRYLLVTFETDSFSGPLQPFFGLSKKVFTNDCSLTICP